MRRRLELAIFILILAVMFYRFQSGRENQVSRYDTHMVEHCVGRNTIRLPETFQRVAVTTGMFKPLGLTTQDSSFSVVVNNGNFSRESFTVEVDKRRADLKENGDGTVDVFRGERIVDNGAVIFRVQRIDDAYVSEINFLVGKSLVTVKLNSYNNHYVEAEENLSRFVSAVKENNTMSFDAKLQGFCLGSVVIAGSFKDERGAFLFKSDDGSDFDIEINTFSPDADEPLLKRMSGPDSLLTIFNVNHKVIRSGERRILNMRAQEWLGWAKLSDEEGAKSFKFAMETMRSSPSMAMPSINLTFNTGKPLPGGGTAKTTLSDDQAVQLWDNVVGSIKSTVL